MKSYDSTRIQTRRRGQHYLSRKGQKEQQTMWTTERVEVENVGQCALSTKLSLGQQRLSGVENESE